MPRSVRRRIVYNNVLYISNWLEEKNSNGSSIKKTQIFKVMNIADILTNYMNVLSRVP